jgi:sulfatase maturation enzyme AslB (radical SAM superfamily)
MACQDVFCNSPWYELHIYWDGSFGYCCQQTPNLPYPVELKSLYNIKNMSIADWHNSAPMRKARMLMHSNTRMSDCYACWHQEEFSLSSRRHRANAKSVIFKQAFNNSFLQSPNYPIFDHSYRNKGETPQSPLDLHIDLGNYCNLACKFCCPEASSKIARQYGKWDLLGGSKVVNDWTKDNDVWRSFLAQIVGMKIQNIHFMGGETLITPRFEDLLDKLIEHELYDTCISFVTNGTTYEERLINKLLKFKRVGIEISIETTTKHNEYIRQGTCNAVVIGNIMRYQSLTTDTVNLTIRPAVSLLSIGYYHTLLQFCLDNKLLLKSGNVIREVGWMSSKCMDVRVLPLEIRQTYKSHYASILDKLEGSNSDNFNESNPDDYKNVVRGECIKCITLLDAEFKHNLYPDLIEVLNKWDAVYNMNAIELYPELKDVLLDNGYVIN